MPGDHYLLALLLQTLLFGLAVLAVWLPRRESAFSPIAFYLLFHAIVFVFRPWIEWIWSIDSIWNQIGFHPDNVERGKALAVSSAALVALALGYLARMHRSGRSFHFSHQRAVDKYDLRALLLVGVLVVPLALYSIWVTRTGAGLSERSSVSMVVVEGVIVNTSGLGYLTDAQNAILGLIALCFAFRRFRPFAFAMLAIYLARKFLTGGGRWGIVLPLVGYGLWFMYQRGKRWPPISYVAMLVPLFVIFMTLGEDRYALTKILEGRKYELTTKSDRTLKERLDNPDFANFDYLAYVVNVVPAQSRTYTYGTQYLQLLTEPIPRRLWPGKPAGPPIKLVDLNDYGNFFGLTLSFPGDLWLSFGWFGVVLGSLLVGNGLARVYAAFRSGELDLYQRVAYVMAVPLLVQFYRDGGLVSFTKFLLFVVGPIFLVRWVSAQLRGINRLRLS